ncbi:MAG TPA: response regulator transcription factor [Acidimicrobiales bacterium]|nr:response regulator transcription factor [Acidimicrobiales bacterium]
MGEPLAMLCVDDQRTFLDALRIAITSDPVGDLRCAGGATSVAEALEILDHTAVDVVLMDFDLPDVDGIDGTRRVKSRHPDVRVVILTALADLDVYLRAAAAGADGFIAKDTPIDQLIRMIRMDARGLTLDESILRSLRARVGDEGSISGRTWRPDLTLREKEVLALLAAGIDATNIARQLGITVHTCRGYVRNVLTKLGAHSQLEAVAVAHQAGLLLR